MPSSKLSLLLVFALSTPATAGSGHTLNDEGSEQATSLDLDFSDPGARPYLKITRMMLEAFAEPKDAKRPTDVVGTTLQFDSKLVWQKEFKDYISIHQGHPITRNDVQDIREYWQTHFNAARSIRGDASIITDELAGFKAATEFRSWPMNMIVFSAIKRHSRAIYHSPESFPRRVSVAETLESDTGDSTAPVRETEIAIERLDGSGNWDFYAYGPDGKLANESEFPGGMRPAPLICAGCHFSNITGVSRRNPVEAVPERN